MRLCLYHGNCWDGFGAAYAMWRRYGSGITSYRAVNYGDDPVELPSDTHELWLLDFTYPREVLERYRAQVDTLVIIDHHKTAREALEGFGCDVKIFDMDHSGAYLTYRHLNPDAEPEDVPLLYDYLQDRDLWRFELPESKAVNAYIRTIPYDFIEWTKLEVALADDFENVVKQGAATLRLVDRTVEMMCKQARIEKFGGYDVPTVNAAAFWSETGHEMLRLHPQAKMVCLYFDRADEMRVYSLRSQKGFDCSAVAREFGGGGHPTAAGFTLPRTGTFF